MTGHEDSLVSLSDLAAASTWTPNPLLLRSQIAIAERLEIIVQQLTELTTAVNNLYTRR
mgnify:FL=1|jgi:hypothetical protein